LFDFIVNRRQHAVVGVLACWVVEHLDVIEHILPCSATCEVCPPPDALPFQQLEEALGHSIIMAISALAHAGDQVVFAKERLPLSTGKL